MIFLSAICGASLEKIASMTWYEISFQAAAATAATATAAAAVAVENSSEAKKLDVE